MKVKELKELLANVDDELEIVGYENGMEQTGLLPVSKYGMKVIDDWEAKKADTSYYEVYRIKDSLSVYFMNEWTKVKNMKDFKGCKYVYYGYNSKQDSNGVYIGGDSFIYLSCQPHRALPENIGTFKLRRIEPDRGENELMTAMYLTDWTMPQKDTVETLVIQNGQKLPESEARKIAQDFAKSMGLIQ